MFDEPMEIADDVIDAASVVWAKSVPHEPPAQWWLPLWQHLDDTADVAGRLWDTWVSPVVKDLVAQALPEGDEDARRLVVWLAGSHDLGKASPAFSVQVPVLHDEMVRHGLVASPTVLQDRNKLRHEVAGAAILEEWLDDRFGYSKSARRQFSDVVAGHHGAYPTGRVVNDARDSLLLGRGRWRDVQRVLTERSAARAGVLERLPDWKHVLVSQPAQLLVTGVIIMADWIASTESYFPVFPIADVPPMPPATSVRDSRCKQAWARLRLDERWASNVPEGTVEDVFAERFPGVGAPRPVQRAAFRRAREMPSAGLMIIEAPMGEGKTEAALLAAEVLAARCGSSGVFLALPTQATSNAMFDRMLTWMRELPAGRGARTRSVSLVHGKAALNETFGHLPFGREPADVSDEPLSAGDPGSSNHSRLRAAVHEWMRGRKRAALADFVVGTIDQLLFGALVARHVMLRQLSLAAKVVVIDEVHASDVYMSQFLDCSIEWLAASGTPVILLSATLPGVRRAELCAAYERGSRRFQGLEPLTAEERASRAAVLTGHLGYPSITSTSEEGAEIETLPASGRRVEVTLQRIDDDPDTLVDLLAERLRDGGSAVVVRNTVRRVQQTAVRLIQHFGRENVTIAHAQFLAADRLAHDADLLQRFGPPGPGVERPPGPHIVVASQVVEQSLDLDFDLMVTDAAPIDLVLQRMGRLHRHNRPDRPAPVSRPLCFLAGVDWQCTPPEPTRGSSVVYGRWPLYRSLAVLAGRWDGGTIQLPDDIPWLVQRAHSAQNVIPESWRVAVTKAKTAFAKEESARRAAAASHVLPEVGAAGSNLYDFSHASAGNVDEDSPQGQACVRDGGESVEVVVVQRSSDGVDRVPDWVVGGGTELPMRHVPVPYETARLLARCTLRLPRSLSHPGIVDQVLDELEEDYFEGWQASAFLSGQLALLLDGDGSRTLAGFTLHYDQSAGLTVDRELQGQ